MTTDIPAIPPLFLPHDAPQSCCLCPRLVAYRRENQEKHPTFYNGPVPSFGVEDPRLMIVGLAPGLKGANRTARPFTGDYAGDLLYQTLDKFGYSRGQYQAAADDGLMLLDCQITNAVRCVPPQNKTTPAEEKSCRPFLLKRIAQAPRLRVILALGLVAHNAVVTAFAQKKAAFKFGHGAVHALNDHITLIDSYHCSRYNTNTRRLTPEMFESVFHQIGAMLP